MGSCEALLEPGGPSKKVSGFRVVLQDVRLTKGSSSPTVYAFRTRTSRK